MASQIGHRPEEDDDRSQANTTSSDELAAFSNLSRGAGEIMVIRTLQRFIEPIFEPIFRRLARRLDLGTVGGGQTFSLSLGVETLRLVRTLAPKPFQPTKNDINLYVLRTAFFLDNYFGTVGVIDDP
ncbi:hypothetical protein R6Q59_034111 [Mikania micrantha]